MFIVFPSRRVRIEAMQSTKNSGAIFGIHLDPGSRPADAVFVEPTTGEEIARGEPRVRNVGGTTNIS